MEWGGKEKEKKLHLLTCASITPNHTYNTTNTQQAVRDFVGPDHYEYYSVKVTDPEADLTISCTPYTGGKWLLLC